MISLFQYRTFNSLFYGKDPARDLPGSRAVFPFPMMCVGDQAVILEPSCTAGHFLLPGGV